MAEIASAKVLFGLAEEYLDYLKMHSQNVNVPDDEQQREALIDIIKIEQKLIEYFSDHISEFIGPGSDSAHWNQINQIFESIKSARNLKLAAGRYVNLRPYEGKLRAILEIDNLPYDIRENIVILTSVVKRLLRNSTSMDSEQKADRKKDAIQQWRDKLGCGLDLWKK